MSMIYPEFQSSAVVYGLTKQPMFNGTFVAIGKFDETKQRYHAMLCMGGKIKSILLKKTNLLFVNELNEDRKQMKRTNANDDDEKKLEQDKQAPVAPRVSRFDASDIVLIHSLQNSKQFNQLFANIVDYNHATQRYHVSFDYQGKMCQKFIKRSNLKLVFPSKYQTPSYCVVCPRETFNPARFTCPGCISVQYCSQECRHKHWYHQNHQDRCILYRCNMLFNSLNFKYILFETLEAYTDSQRTELITREALNYAQYQARKPNEKKQATKAINDWSDWMKHFGFVDYEIVGNHSYPMTVYYILKRFILNGSDKKWESKKTINIHLVGCEDNEFAGIEQCEVIARDYRLNSHRKRLKMKRAKEYWKFRWRLLSDLLQHKLNITCYGDQLSRYATDLKDKNINMTIKRRLHAGVHEPVPDLVIGLHAGVHEHDTWRPVVRHCLDAGIPCIFSEANVMEYQIWIREFFLTLGMQNSHRMQFAFNPFRDPRVQLHPRVRRLDSFNTFLYGII
eukprot:169283_1